MPCTATTILTCLPSAFFNNITYVEPRVPTLYTVMSSGEHASNPAIYGSHTNSFVLRGNETVEIIVNNNDDGVRPPFSFSFSLSPFSNPQTEKET